MLQAIRGEHAIVEKIEDWRELSKLKSTYLDALPELIEASTGRLHHLQPDLDDDRPAVEHQPEPPERPDPDRARPQIRSCFVAEEGHKLISADYSQVELRVLAHIAGEDA